jgi:cob(I)alamin adenosyltransferase
VSDEQYDPEEWRRRQQRQKRIIDRRIAKADEDRGVIVVNTGNGKGKSTAAFGMVARALGHGYKVGVVQFIKGSYSTGEETFFRQFDNVDYHVMGEGFTWETQDRDRDVAAAEAAFAEAERMLADPSYHLVVMDELNIVLHKQYLPMERVMTALAERPAMQHAVITGRYAPDELTEVADTVSHVKMVKHAFKEGVRAQTGVEL